MNKVSYIKIKNSAHLETSQRNQKDEPQTKESNIIDKKLVSKTYKELQ